MYYDIYDKAAVCTQFTMREAAQEKTFLDKMLDKLFWNQDLPKVFTIYNGNEKMMDFEGPADQALGLVNMLNIAYKQGKDSVDLFP